MSLVRTGAAIAKGKKVRAWSIQTTPRMGSYEKRIDFIWIKIRSLIEKHRPEYVVIEGYAFGRAQAAVRSGELAGVIKHHLWTMKVPPFDLLPPPSLKLFATGSGKASKAEMVEAARLIWPQVNNDDEADAIFLAMKAQEILNNGSSTTEGEEADGEEY